MDENEKVTQVVIAEPSVLEQPPKISDECWNLVIGTWVDQHLRSTPVAQSSEGWNHLMSVIPRLRELLEAEL